ncbi:MAG TPA: hypothetical protein VFO00_14455 [Vitreimonas sp.]|nr:hypothetical protein [Vitreimonas sp.]
MAESIRTAQWPLALMLAAAACATFVAAAAGAHFTPVIQDHVERQIERQAAVNGMYLYNDGYVDDGDYVLLGQIPNADFSRGGVYFIGPSEMKLTLMPWRLSPEESALIHNYSIGDFRHSDVHQYVRMLVEEAGLLQAGAERTTIFLGLSTEMTREPSRRYIGALFERHGHYTFDRSGEMHIRAMSPAERAYRLGRNSANRFLSILFLAPNKVRTLREIEQLPENQLRSGDWRPAMEMEVRILGQTIDYLQARGVDVRAIYPPQASWRRDVDYSRPYFEMVSAVLAARSVPLIDQRDLLADAEFGDAVHARYNGQLKLHDAYLDLARDALDDMGMPMSTVQLTNSTD